METVINCNIDNLIRNYCHNFLSYLYKSRGWNRTMFEMGKETFIVTKNRKIRIVIMNTGTILITCSSLMEILEAISFIEDEFSYGRMRHYLVVDPEVKFSTNFITTIPLDNYYYEDELVEETKYGTVSVFQDSVTLKYKKYEDGKELINVIEEIFSALEIDEEEEEEEEYEEDSSENLLFSMLTFFVIIKLGEYL